MVGPVHEATVTDVEAALTVLHEAVAFAVIEAPLVKAVNPLSVQALEVTVVVPKDVAPLKTSIVVPFASELVPETDVAFVHIGDVTVGVELADGVVQVSITLPEPPSPPIQGVMPPD